MNNYTIAERQAIKDKLADEKYFEKDLQLFERLFPHHVLIGECKRVNSVNKLSLDRKVIYHLLARVGEEEIRVNRGDGSIRDIVKNTIGKRKSAIAKFFCKIFSYPK